MSNPPWMNGGASAPANPYAQQPAPSGAYVPNPYAQQQQRPPAHASTNWMDLIANAKPLDERLPKLSVGHSYVLDADHFDEPEPGMQPGTLYFGAVFRVIESTDPGLPPGATCTVRNNLHDQYGYGPRRVQALLQTVLESFSGKQVTLTADDFRSAIAFAITKPCPLAGKARVYVVASASKSSDKDGKPYADLAWEPMQPGVGSKGLVVTQAQPAQAPQGAGVFAGAPWAQQTSAPAQAQPWAPQGTAPAAALGWPAGIVQTNGQGGQGR